MKISPIRLLIAAIITFFPVVLWNIIYLEHIDSTGKLIAWILAPVFALAATIIFMGSNEAAKPLFVKGKINPFWGWFAGELVIEIFIAALSNT